MSESTKDVDLVEVGKVKLNNPLIIGGFVGAGLVGSISAEQIVKALKMVEIAFVKSPYLPPLAVFIGGRLRHPFRIYASEDGKVCVVICEIPLGTRGLYAIASKLVDWAQNAAASEFLVLDGIPVDNLPEERVPYCAAESGKCDLLREKGIQTVSKGFIGGIAGSILNECLVRKIEGTVFLTPALSIMPDPEAAAKLIESVNKAYGMKIDVSELLNRAREIRSTLQEVSKQYEKSRKMETAAESPESLYL